MNEIPKTPGPFFEGLQESIRLAVPLAVEKFRLDQMNRQWEQKLAETAEAHRQNESIRKINAATNLISTGLTSDNPALAQQGLQIVAEEAGIPTTTLPQLSASPAIQAKAEALRREQAFNQEVYGKNLSPEQILKTRLKYFPDEALKVYQITEAAKAREEANAERAAYLRALAGKGAEGTKEYIGTDEKGNPLLLNKKTGVVAPAPVEGGIKAKPSAPKGGGSALDRLLNLDVGAKMPAGAQTGTYKGRRAYKVGDKFYDMTTNEEIK